MKHKQIIDAIIEEEEMKHCNSINDKSSQLTPYVASILSKISFKTPSRTPSGNPKSKPKTSSRKKSKHPSIDPNAAQGSLITDHY